MSPLPKNRNINMDTKLRTIKSCVWAILLYGCECWTITNEIKRTTEAVEVWFLRRHMKISWAERKTNEEVL